MAGNRRGGEGLFTAFNTATRNSTNNDATTDTDSVIVTCIRPGKETQSISVSRGTTIGQVMRNLGWSTGSSSYRLTKIGEASRDANETTTFDVGGQYELNVAPRLAGAI